ncbi:MAG: hypothetical protein LBV79_10080, partial [Candidatus Adiutrix sp.]|nr:hypothetical protein [Candidatus Adiutrix sp.]
KKTRGHAAFQARFRGNLRDQPTERHWTLMENRKLHFYLLLTPEQLYRAETRVATADRGLFEIFHQN